jgi:predicted Rdx family selenoprotein
MKTRAHTQLTTWTTFSTSTQNPTHTHWFIMSQQVCTDCTPTAPSSAPSASAPASAAASPAAAALAATADITAPVTTYPHVLIEYCDRCRWWVLEEGEGCSMWRSIAYNRAPRASWTQTELLLTFPPPLIRTISLQPLNTPETGGRFRVWVDVAGKGWELAWDRKVGGWRLLGRNKCGLTSRLRAASPSSSCSSNACATLCSPRWTSGTRTSRSTRNESQGVVAVCA